MTEKEKTEVLELRAALLRTQAALLKLELRVEELERKAAHDEQLPAA